jgi:hypothetical protein
LLTYLELKTYKVDVQKVDWYMAKIDCSLKGMELVSIESPEEQYQIEIAIGLKLHP